MTTSGQGPWAAGGARVWLGKRQTKKQRAGCDVDASPVVEPRSVNCWDWWSPRIHRPHVPSSIAAWRCTLMYTTEERAQRWNAQVRSMSLGAGHNLGRVLKFCDCQDEPCPAMTRVSYPSPAVALFRVGEVVPSRAHQPPKNGRVHARYDVVAGSRRLHNT